MPRSAPENNTDFALIPMNDAALALSPAQRQLNAAASLFAHEDGGRRYTTLTPRKLADLTGCSLRAAQLAFHPGDEPNDNRKFVNKPGLLSGDIDLSLPVGRFIKLVASDPAWSLPPREWAVAVAIKFLMESARSSTTSHTTETIARYAGISAVAVKKALVVLKSLRHIATETRFDQAAGKRRRTVKTGLAPVKRNRGTNSKSNPPQTGDAQKGYLSTRKRGTDGSAKEVPMPRNRGTNSISLFKSKQQEPAAAGNPEAKAVAAAGVISITMEPGNQTDEPMNPLDLISPDVWDALGRFDKTTEDQLAGLVADHLRAHPATLNAWLVELLTDAAKAGNPVGFVIRTMPARWAERQAPLPPAQPRQRMSADKKRKHIEGRGWVDATTPPVNQPPAGDDTLERHRRDREAHAATFAQPEAQRSWPPVPAALATDTGKLSHEAGRLGYGQFAVVDGAWRMSPTIADKMNSRYPDPSPTYAEPPERKAALNGTDTDTPTHRNAEAFTVEAFTGNQGTEAAQPVPTPAAGSTPDAVVDTRPSLPTPQGRSSAPTTRPAVTPSGRLKSPGTGETLPQDRFAKLQAAIRDNQQKNVG